MEKKAICMSKRSPKTLILRILNNTEKNSISDVLCITDKVVYTKCSFSSTIDIQKRAVQICEIPLEKLFTVCCM